MLRLVCLHSIWHYETPKPYYTKLSTFTSHLLKVQWFNLIPNCRFFWQITYMNKSLPCFWYTLLQISCEHISTHVRFKGRCLVINSSYHTCILFIFNPFLYNTTYMYWLATSYDCSSFTMLVWSYHWWSKYPFVSVPHGSECTTTHDTFWGTIKTLLRKMEHMFKRRPLTFAFTTSNDEWISLSPKRISRPWWMSSLLIWFAQLWCNEHQRW